MAEHHLTCAHCGAQFMNSNGIRQRYCGKVCAASAKSAQKREARGKKPKFTGLSKATAQPCMCAVCGQTFTPKAADRNTCCGRECGTKYAGFLAMARKTGGRVFVTITRKKCLGCGKMHSRMGALCGPECRKVRASNQARTKAQADHVSTAIVCHECAATFVPQYGDKSRKFCSSPCLTKNMRRIGRTRRDDRIRSSARRETVDPIKVFIRDGWRCQICKRQTPLRLRGTNKPRAPELDHILPLSCGGDHTYANTQCTCRECNGVKGATPKGQLMLFPTA